jgi:hypothetical protein
MNDATDDLHSNEVNREYWAIVREALWQKEMAMNGKR